MVARAKVRFVANDIWDAPDDDKRYEVIDGRLYATPSPSSRHQRAVSMLHGHIWQYLRQRGGGEVFTAPLGVVLDDGTAVQPDLVYVSTERAAIVSDRGLEGAPDLAVEVLSPSTRARDRGIKMRRYAVAGITHYWIVDLTEGRLEAYELGPAGYELVIAAKRDDQLQPALFAGLSVPVRDLLG